MMESIEIDGAVIDYLDEGDGAPVVFVHGALGDCRTWSRHCALLAGECRAISYTQRYFGMRPWDTGWPPFGVRLHADDLVALIRKLELAPAHVVAWSYGGHVALTVAVEHPELVRGALIYEPGVPTFVTDAAELEAFRADAQRMFAPVFAAVNEGDDALAVRRLLDGSGQRPGFFDQQPEASRRIEMDNARTMALLTNQSEPPEIGCEALARLEVPVTIAYGERTRPLFRIVARAAARCLSGEPGIEVPGAGHMWPDESPAAFVELVRDALIKG